MKRYSLTLILALLGFAGVYAQTYTSLWKQAALAEQKDQPRTELSIMQRIIDKATLDRSYGNLLAAEFRRTVLWGAISEDSIAPAVKRLETKLSETSDATLSSVYHAVLGKLYKENPSLEGKHEEYFKKALERPELLANQRSIDYAPIAVQGQDGTSFYHDMLHVVGFEADTKDAYLLMRDYYLNHGNRGAACLCEYKITQIDRKDDVKLVKKSRYLQTIDSLINVYQDLPEAGELAVEHYKFMVGATDASVSDRINYINYALSNWGSWSRMNELRNAQKELTEPMFHLKDFHKVLLPGKKHWLVLDEVRNVQQVTLAISRLNITADNDYEVSDRKTYKMLLTKTSKLHQIEQTKRFVGKPEYKILKDSFEIAALPVGAYLMELTTDNTSIEPVRQLFYVSDLALMTQQLPDGTRRFVVVSATTGQPVEGANIRISTRGWKQPVRATLTTDSKGEALTKSAGEDIYISTTKDKYLPSDYVYSRRQKYYEQTKTNTYTNVYTDRSIYRPAQTVHVTAIQYSNAKGIETKAERGKEVKFQLRDANYKMVAEKTATTDEYGTATVDFELPQGGLTGGYSVRAGNGNVSFRVEEYKRPTFEITFPKVNQRYTWGDTVVVKATAKTYSGVPVQGAKVSYKVTRRSSLWWWRYRMADEQVYNDTTVTDEDGTFSIEIPLVKPDGEKNNSIARFFNFEVAATVTDLSGESHEGEMSLPLGTKATAFSVNLPELIEKDSLKQMKFSYCNSAGQDISSTLCYRIDKGKNYTANTNTDIDLTAIAKTLKSGEHELTAICEQDTLTQKFTVFSISDGHPAKHTTHWNYQTAETFPRDGKPVYLQVGSSENSAHVVYSFIAGNTLLEKGAWELSDSIITKELTYKEEYASGVVLNYSFVKDGQVYENTMKIERPLPEKKLNVTWKTFRNRLTPGQKEEWTLNITTPDGKPAKAQLMSVLYDKSLDQINQHSWQMPLNIYQSLPNSPWRGNLGLYNNGYWIGASYPTKYYPTYQMDVDKFDNTGKYFNLGGMMSQVYALASVQANSARAMKSRGYALLEGKVQMAADQTVETVAKEEAAVEPMAMGAMDVSNEMENINQSLDAVQVRENLNETAFFYPIMETDKNGNVAVKFTLPESVTTWHFMGLAHDVEMRNGLLTDDVVAQKVVMVQPNMPRFLRESDKAEIAVRIANTSEKKVNGSARLQLINPETNKVVYQKTQKFSADANETVNVSFGVEGLKEGIYIAKTVAEGSGYSDGEQHYLPVLSGKELVMNTLPFTIHEKGTKDFSLESLFSESLRVSPSHSDSSPRLTIEYTNNPSWLMIQVLPSVSNAHNDDAISLMTAIYSNSIARHILTQSPSIKQVMELWKQEKGSETSLMSQLEKNQELKEIVLAETPWVVAADKESEQKQQLIKFFDENQVSSRLSAQIAKLRKLQQSDGAFSWHKDMPGNRYMTTAVAKMIVRLDKMLGTQSNLAGMKQSAIRFLHKKAAEEVKEMKKAEAKKEKVRPSESAIEYLYILSLNEAKLSANDAATRDYLLKRMADRTQEFTIYGKAQAAVILAKNGYKQKAQDYLQSINEYSVYKEEMGRYFDTKKAYYSWFDYKIPTQVAAIEAMQAGASYEKNVVEEMKRWLLMSKRTQAWDTPINTVNAVYAFMNGNTKVLAQDAENASIRLDGKQLSLPKATAGLGYVKTAKEGTFKQLTIEKKNEGTSWGAVYAQFAVPAEDVKTSASGITVKRKVSGGSHMGDKVTVTITITADRDYDFVQVVDKRAACLEPVKQTSGYGWGYYIAPKDNATYYYIDCLSKGKHTFTTEYYIDRKGDYQAGSCSAQCAYSPEYGGRAESYRLNVK